MGYGFDVARILIALFVGILGVTGCGAADKSRPARFGSDGFSQYSHGYHIAFAEESPGFLLGGDWVVSNWQLSDNEPVPRRGEGYKGYIYIDVNGDGYSERYLDFYSDLVFRNRRTGGVVWITVRPVPPAQATLNLDIQMKNFAAALSGSESVFKVGRYDALGVETKVYATKIEASAPSNVGGKPGIAGTISIANTDQLRLDPTHRAGMLRVVMVKVDEDLERKFSNPKLKMNYTLGGPHTALMTIAYYSDPNYFAASLPEFDDLVSRISFEIPQPQTN